MIEEEISTAVNNTGPNLFNAINIKAMPKLVLNDSLTVSDLKSDLINVDDCAGHMAILSWKWDRHISEHNEPPVSVILGQAYR